MAADTLTALAERVEGLTGPCRETDKAIALALGWTTEAPPRDSDRPMPHLWVGPDGSREMASPPHWTGSLDAVVALIERELPGALWYVDRGPVRPMAGLQAAGDGPPWFFYAATPALALLAATLRALARKEGLDGHR